jgi:nitrate/TMAO reductase-like tetraheme cytochrome c subunit
MAMAGSAAPQAASPAENKIGWKKRLRRWLKRAGITAIVVITAGLGLTLVAEHRTSQPSFCGSCHIMQPYYISWEQDIHGGKLDAACVDCHYAPGERTTVKAKLRGLSQVFSYVSGRYGATRPRAHVSNLSCLTAKCHGDGSFMDKPILLGTVTFVHAKHLKYDQAKRDAAHKELEQLTTALREQLGAQRFTELEALAREAGPANRRINAMRDLAETSDVAVAGADLERFSQLHHRQVRVAQLDDLQCTNCHSYSSREPHLQDGGLAHHFSASTNS